MISAVTDFCLKGLVYSVWHLLAGTPTCISISGLVRRYIKNVHLLLQYTPITVMATAVSAVTASPMGVPIASASRSILLLPLSAGFSAAGKTHP